MSQTPTDSSAGQTIVTGLIGIALVLLLACAIIAPFDIQFFMGWVGLVFLAATPTQIVLALLWNTELPASIGKLSQPIKGLALTGVSVVAGAIIAVIAHYSVGGGLGPTPMLTQYMILSVVVALWIIPIWQAWPFSLASKNPIIVGLASLLGFYLIAWVLWTLLFNYDVLSEAPFYSADHAPSGVFDMWTAMVFAVTSGAVVVIHVLFDFWPIDKLSFGKAQPIRGLIASLYILAFTALVHFVLLGKRRRSS